MPLYLNGSTGISGVDGTALVPAFQGANTGAGVYYSANTVSITGSLTANSLTTTSGNVTLNTVSITGSLTANSLTTTSGNVTLNTVSITGSLTANSLSLTTTSGNVTLNKPGVRQTVISGPTTSAGLADCFPSTSASLSLTSQNISTGTNALVIGAAQGITSLGTQDVIGYYTSNLTWSGLTGSTTNYLYINASTGATGFTTLAPIYQIGGTPSVTNGQFTFNIAAMTGYLGNGTTAPATPIVFVGEAVTGASSVTSTVAYAYNGYYDSGATNTIPSAGVTTSKNHNIGTDYVDTFIVLKCLTTDGGYAVNDVITTPPTAASLSWTNFTTRNSWGFTTISGQNPNVANKSGGATASLTRANWSYRMIAKRKF